MFIYRIEDDTKHGPYSSSKIPMREHFCFYSTSKRPVPSCDKFEKDYDGYNSLCAFKSKKQMLSWFSKKELSLMFSLGFHLLVTIVDRKEVIVGKRQVLINRTHLLHRREKGIKIRSVQEL